MIYQCCVGDHIWAVIRGVSEGGIGYILVGGGAIVSKYKNGDPDTLPIEAIRGEESASAVTYVSYKAVCGTGNTMGEGGVSLE